MDGVRRVKEFIAAGDAYQVVISRRLDTELRADPVHGLSRAPHHQPVAVPVLPAAGQDQHRRLLAGGAGAARGRSGGGAAHRGHASARADRGGGRPARDRDAAPIPRSAPSTSCWSTSAATTSAGSAASAPSRCRSSWWWSATRTSCTWSATCAGRSSRARTPSTCSRACFPAGTLTGAPKIRAMEIIEEIEPTRRGPYGGRGRLHLVLRQPGLVHHHPHGGLPRAAGLDPGRGGHRGRLGSRRRSGSRRAPRPAA